MGSRIGGRFGWPACAVAATLLFGWTLTLPWNSDDFVLGPWVRVLMAASGASLMLLTAWRRPQVGARTAAAVSLLGLTVLLYPSLLALKAAGIGDRGIVVVASGWHVVPLTLTQLVPVIASRAVTGRSARNWTMAILAVAIASALCTGLTLFSDDGAAFGGAVGLAATVLWFGGFVLAPIAAWTAVAGTSGETRRRAIVASLASILPLVIVVWCASLSVIGSAIGWTQDAGVTALMLGFAVGTWCCGGLTLVATARSTTGLRTRPVLVTMNVLTGTVIGVLTAVTVVLMDTSGWPAGWALVAGAGLAIAVALPWIRLHGWARRVVDPAAELGHELAVLGAAPDGGQRAGVLHVLRKLVGAPELDLLYRVSGADWATSDGALTRADDEDPVLARSGDGSPTVLARGAQPATRNRLLALGDCTSLLRPALRKPARSTLPAGPRRRPNWSAPGCATACMTGCRAGCSASAFNCN